MFSPNWLLGSGSGRKSEALVPKQGLGELLHIPLETRFWAGRLSLGVCGVWGSFPFLGYWTLPPTWQRSEDAGCLNV